MTVRHEFDLEKRLREGPVSNVHICICSYNDRIAEGLITSIPDKQEIPFCGLDQAVLIIEELMDQKQRTIPDYRSIDVHKENRSWLDNHICLKPQGSSRSFLIRVYGRQHRSLQGEVRAGEETCCFRSGMELMRLMHQYLQARYEKPLRRYRTLLRENQKIISVTGGERHVENENR